MFSGQKINQTEDRAVLRRLDDKPEDPHLTEDGVDVVADMSEQAHTAKGSPKWR